MRFTAMNRGQRGKLAMATAALGIGLLSLTGCGYINAQQTTEQYSASDGTRTDLGALKLRNFIASKENGIEAGKVGYFSPHTSFDITLYPSKTQQKIADVLYKASAVRFDGSDLMPGKVGAGTFWTEPVKWISGQQDLDTTLNAIDASFPKASS